MEDQVKCQISPLVKYHQKKQQHTHQKPILHSLIDI